MGLNMKEKKVITKETIKRYALADKKGKNSILNEFVALTSYNRKYAIHVLNSYFKMSKGSYMGHDFTSVKIKSKTGKNKRIYKSIYDKNFVSALSKIWNISSFMCGQRLVPFIRENIDTFIKNKSFEITESMRPLFLSVSSATVDRLLKHSRALRLGKGISTTKASSELNKLIPIRTFFDWDERIPGFFEVDTVSHDGGNASGEHCYTVDVTDVCTGWTELRAVKNKAQIWVVEAINDVKMTIFYPMKGIDSDNGSEFKNQQLQKWCEENKIEFTRIRPYKKNDNCFVEQKNRSIIRKFVGYYRYEGEEMTEKLNNFYKYLCILINFFYPSMKIISKERIDEKILKKYDEAKTPYKRTLESPDVSEADKEKLKKMKSEFDFIELTKNMNTAFEKLYKILESKHEQS